MCALLFCSVYVLQRRSPVRGDDWHGMVRQQYDTSSVVNARAQFDFLLCTVFFLLHGLSLPVRTGNALQNELTNNGTPVVLSARAHLLDVIFGALLSGS